MKLHFLMDAPVRQKEKQMPTASGGGGMVEDGGGGLQSSPNVDCAGQSWPCWSLTKRNCFRLWSWKLRHWFGSGFTLQFDGKGVCHLDSVQGKGVVH